MTDKDAVLLEISGDPSPLPICPGEETRKLSREKRISPGLAGTRANGTHPPSTKVGKRGGLGWGKREERAAGREVEALA